ncbi:MAG: DUF4956 domain-containing protein [Flavobacteriaceae bacterium]|nr:DUF4956 domain-containing protein [Flavobacteriaceae bacterium]MBT5012200.1 DUF4956 domain-containing protein [Flavobacteriaceae bacterium]MBT7320047.1 DUF4956 domain-containing protein [Flavobacteriaceae bacterium]
MDELLNLSNLQLSNTSLLEFLIGFILTIIYSLVIRIIYTKYSVSVSNKVLIANTFPLFSISIFLIVITIKSSIVLSLGLVGALSIIRFRTAIKEPEQIVYFLILTGISISAAAGAYLYPLFFIFFIYIYNQYTLNSVNKSVYSVNDQLVITVNKIENYILNDLVNLLNENNVNVEIQSINKREDNTVIVLKLSDFNLKSLTLVEEFFKNKKTSIKDIQFFSSSE